MQMLNQLQAVLRDATKDQPLAGAATAAGLPRDAIRSVLIGHDPRLSRVEELLKAFGLEFYIGPPREDGGAAAEQEAGSFDSALLPEVRCDMEISARSLNRAVVAVGGDPIPKDLWPVLDERRGVAEAAVRDIQPGVDLERLRLAIESLEMGIDETGIEVVQELRAELIVAIYEYLENDAGATATAEIIQLIQRSTA